MLEDMAMRGLREETQRDYIRFVRSFAAFLGRPPETATAEDIRRFQVHIAGILKAVEAGLIGEGHRPIGRSTRPRRDQTSGLGSPGRPTKPYL
jgi:hypothetical protein